MFTITKTKEEIIKDELVKINQVSEFGLMQLITANKRAYDMFWKNPNVTPQEFCDLMGNEAYKLFQSSASSQEFIKSMKSDHVELSIPENWSVEFNQDGTVNVTYTEPTLPIEE